MRRAGAWIRRRHRTFKGQGKQTVMADKTSAALLHRRSSAQASMPWVYSLPGADAARIRHAEERLGPARGILLGAAISLALWLTIGLTAAWYFS